MQFIDLGAQQKRIRSKIQKRINNVLDHGKYIMGPEVFELEFQLAEYVGRKYCISCSSGTDALLIPLMAKKIGVGDAVITTPFTYIATAEVIKLLGATPIFVDIYSETFNINPDGIPKAVKYAKDQGLCLKAIIAVDLFGLPARYRLIEEYALENNLFLIEDAAQGFGGSIREKKAGSFGDCSSTSFFPAKPLGCYGDGGAIFTDDEELEKKMKSIRIHGGGKDKYDNVRLGINGRLDTIQAAILIEKLSIFEEEITLRNKIASFYLDSLSTKMKKPFVPDQYKSSWAQFSIIANSKLEKEKCSKLLNENGIPTMNYYPIPLHLQKVFSYLGYKRGQLPISEKISDSIFSIPMYPYMNKSDQSKIVDLINEF